MGSGLRVRLAASNSKNHNNRMKSASASVLVCSPLSRSRLRAWRRRPISPPAGTAISIPRASISSMSARRGGVQPRRLSERPLRRRCPGQKLYAAEKAAGHAGLRLARVAGRRFLPESSLSSASALCWPSITLPPYGGGAGGANADFTALSALRSSLRAVASASFALAGLTQHRISADQPHPASRIVGLGSSARAARPATMAMDIGGGAPPDARHRGRRQRPAKRGVAPPGPECSGAFAGTSSSKLCQ